MRRPRGYVGRRHETIGSDILAVLGVVSMPKQTLGPALNDKLQKLSPNGWYGIDLMLELMEALDARIGVNGLRQMGRKLFAASHEAHVRGVAKSARDILTSFDDLYKRANRGEAIGGWKVLDFGPGKARLEKTTPHHCALEEGIVSAALGCVDVPATVTQESCLRRGADSCIFVVASVITDKRWGG